VRGGDALEEVPDRLLGRQHMKRHVLSVLGDDLAFDLRLRAVLPPDAKGQTPLVAQSPPARVGAPFG
jgi:hypothetical protein